MTTKENINVPGATAILTLRDETDKPFAEGTPYFINMKLISLTQGKFTMVDDDVFDYLNQFKWHAEKIGNTYYAVNWINRKNKKGSMHRIIMNTPKGMDVDHIDHNGLNNQKSNLRNCTRQQNICNKVGNSATGYKGVYFIDNGITAQIWYNGKNHHIGRFKTTKDAAIAYDEMAKMIQGEFACLNFKNKENA